MFLKHFGLTVNPFGMSPQLDFLYKSTAFEESMAHLAYGLQNSEAIVLITGPIGSGKTMSLQSFLANLGENHLSALVTNTQVSTVELLKLILEDLGVVMGPGCDKSDLLIAFKGYLVKARQDGRKVVVVIDEAQNLNPDVLEEVRLLTNLGQGMEQPVQLILVGQPELKEIVNRPELAQLRQRIRVHYEVETLGFEEMVGYVNHRMEVAGCPRPVFEADALERLFEISGGIPRLVNTHAGEALLSAFVAQRLSVSLLDVEEGAQGAEVENERPPIVKKPVPAKPKKTQTVADQTNDDGPRYAHRTARRHAGSGRRSFWITVVLLVSIASAVWYTMFRGEKSTPEIAAVGVSTTSLPAVADSVPVVIAPVEESEPDTVRQEDLEPAVDVEPQEPVRVPVGIGYFTHVASFRDSVRSQVYLGRLKRRSLSGRVEKVVVNGEEWYRVYIGPVATRVAARLMANRLVESGEVNYYKIVRRAADDGTGLVTH